MAFRYFPLNPALFLEHVLGTWNYSPAEIQAIEMIYDWQIPFRINLGHKTTFNSLEDFKKLKNTILFDLPNKLILSDETPVVLIILHPRPNLANAGPTSGPTAGPSARPNPAPNTGTNTASNP